MTCYYVLIVVILSKISLSLSKQNVTFASNRNLSTHGYYDELCLNSCLCGLLRHPTEAARNNDDVFSRYVSHTIQQPIRNQDVIVKWLFETTSSFSMTFPISLIFCRNQHQWKKIYQVKRKDLLAHLYFNMFYFPVVGTNKKNTELLLFWYPPARALCSWSYAR